MEKMLRHLLTLNNLPLTIPEKWSLNLGSDIQLDLDIKEEDILAIRINKILGNWEDIYLYSLAFQANGFQYHLDESGLSITPV